MSDYTWQAGSGRNISLKLTMEDAETGTTKARVIPTLLG